MMHTLAIGRPWPAYIMFHYLHTWRLTHRGLGRDVLFFAGSVFLIRVVMAGLAEEPLGSGPGATKAL